MSVSWEYSYDEEYLEELKREKFWNTAYYYCTPTKQTWSSLAALGSFWRELWRKIRRGYPSLSQIKGHLRFYVLLAIWVLETKHSPSKNVKAPK